MPPLNILHVIPAVACRYGGPSMATYAMCRALGTRGVTTIVATTDADGPGRLPVERGRIVAHEGVPTIFFARQASEAFKYSHGLARWLDAHVRDFDLVHVHAVFSHSSVAAARACRRHGVPYVVRPLGTLDPWSLAQKRWRKRLFLSLLARPMFRHAAALDYTTAEERRLAEQAVGLSNGVVVPLGLPDEAFEPRARTEDVDAPYVIALCRLDPKKRLDLLIQAFLELCRPPRHPAWRLVIAGDGEPRHVARLKRLAGSGQSGSPVRFVGWVSGDEKRRLLSGASLFAMPSYQENFGIAAVEAMALGVPVLVAPGVNLAPDIEAAGAGWVVEGTVAAVQGALQDAMDHPAERLRRGAAARRFAERFRWSAVIDDLIAEYQDAIGTARPLAATG